MSFLKRLIEFGSFSNDTCDAQIASSSYGCLTSNTAKPNAIEVATANQSW